MSNSERNHFCPLYQIIFNVARFAASKRWRVASAKVQEEKKKEETADLNTSTMSTFEGEAYRSPIFIKFIETLSNSGSVVNKVMHSIVMEQPWEAIAQPVKQAGLQELRKLKSQYKQFKEVKSRQTTDI